MTNETSKRRAGWMSASALIWGLAGAVAASVSGYGVGAEITSYRLSASEQARPFVLDQNGRRIAMLKGGRELPTNLPAGVAPTYLAYRLADRSDLPDGVPTISTTGQGRPAMGLLRLDALAKSSLDAELAKSGHATVLMPRQAFLVESWGGTVLSDVAGGTKTWRADVEPQAQQTPRPNGKNDSFEGTVKDWYNTSSNAIKNWNEQALDALKGMFKTNSPKPVIIPPKTATQILTPPDGVDAAAQIMPAPVPEPSSLLVFAAVATAAAWRLRSRRSGK